VQHDDAGAIKHPLMHAIDNLVRNLAVGHVSPPHEDIGIGDHLLSQPMFRLIQRRCLRFDAVDGVQSLGDCAVDSDRIRFPDVLVLDFVTILVPDCDANWCCHADLSPVFVAADPCVCLHSYNVISLPSSADL
jgi:hypothetical protein